MRKKGLIKHKAKLSIFTLVLFCLTLVPLQGIPVKAENNLISPVIEGNKITFNYIGTEDVTKVYLAGSMYGGEWGQTKQEMLYNESEGIWTITSENLKEGNYTYKFVVEKGGNQEWIIDPLNSEKVDDGYGGNNSVFIIGNVLKSPEIDAEGNVTFKARHEGDELYLVGSMNNWDNTGIEMTKDSDGIFTKKIQGLNPGIHEYQFLPSSGSWDGQFKDPLNPISIGNNSVFYIAGLYKINGSDNIEVAKSTELTAMVLLSNGNEEATKDVKWTVDNDDVAEISDDGLLTIKITELPDGQNNIPVVVTAKSGDGEVNKTINIVDKVPNYGDKKVVLVGNLQDELTNGKEGDWNPGSDLTRMEMIAPELYAFTGTLPAGDYEFKIAMGSWDESYGVGNYTKPNNEGKDNIVLKLQEEKEITFYFSDKIKKIADSTYYTMASEEKRPRLAGTIQTAMGESEDWKPENSTLKLYDYGFDGVYSIDLKSVPKGSYEFKVTIGGNWDESYGDNGGNYKLNVPETCDVNIAFNSESKVITAKVNAIIEGDFDGQVNGSKLYHNTWDSVYKYPFGAVAEGTDVTVRMHAQKGDLQYARVLVRNNKTNRSDLYNMEKVSTIVVDETEVDIWEVTFTPEDKGVYGYKFIAGDGDAAVYYGEDGQEGKVGIAGDKNAPFFQLTVYDRNYKTPEWMKEAVVYQIFPDRFNNGDTSNDNAKENARGEEPIEVPKSWNSLPDNPRLGENNMNDIDGAYSGDGIWSNDFFGGDIKGVQGKLDYLQSIGVNTVYLNPISMAASNHKYDATDYKRLDPMFGSEKDFIEFTTELERRGMKLIVDGVFNHVGDDSIYFDRYSKYETVGAYEYWSYVYDTMNNDKVSEEVAMTKADDYFVKSGQKFSSEKWHLWFNIKNNKVDIGTTTERYDYQGWWGYDSLPEFKSMSKDEAISLGLSDKSDEFVNKLSEWNNKALVDYIYKAEDSVAKQWVDWGADGWRLDVANEVETTFWNDFREEMKAHNSETLILGEIWDDASKYFLGDEYDSVMNYRIRGALIDYLKNGNAERLNDTLMAIYEDYPKEAFYALMNLMGSHDVARAIYILGGGSDTAERAEFGSYDMDLGKQRLKLAALFEFGYPGAPTIYYGDEAGVTGTKDPDCRRTYPWGNEDTSLIDFYEAIGSVREGNKDLLSHGDLTTLYSKDKIYVYGRSYNDEHAIVAINPTDADATVTVDLKEFTGNGTEFVDELVGDYKVTVKDGKAIITIPAMTGRMMISSNVIKLPESVKKVNGIEGNSQVELSWDTVKGAKEYKVYSSSFKGSLQQEVKTVTKTSTTVDSLINGNKLYFAVSVIDENGNESLLTWSDELIPHSIITNISNISDVTVKEVDIATLINVTAEVFIEGISNAEGVSTGLVGRLLVKYPGDENFTVIKTSYKGEVGENDEFIASFIPTKPGKYEYKFEFTTKGVGGFNYKDSIKSTEVKSFELIKGDDVVATEAIALNVPEQQSGEVNLTWSIGETNNIALYEIVRDGIVIARIKDGSITSYKDTDVSNKTEYSYKVIAYSNGGKEVASNEVVVTPDLVMVEVTFKLKAPSYTPLDTKVTMPGQMNGWSVDAWEMSRNGAVTTDWTYTISVLEGEVIEYKYTKGGSWDQEALMNYSNPKAANQSKYGCTTGEGGNEKITVENQGDGKMIVENEVIRWKDMPVVILDPSTGSYTKNETIIVKGNAMLDPNLTINGELVVVDEKGEFAHEVKLSVGKNTLNIHIEPTEENKNNPDIFNNNEEAIGFATKDLTLEITRIEGDEEIPTDVKVTGVSLDKDIVTVGVGNTFKLNATVNPDNATNKEVTWSSSDENIAKVDSEGNVTIIAEGTANIIVTTVDGGFTATCKVEVNPNMEGLNSIPVINAEDKVITVGDKFNPLEGVIANDEEDGDLTNEIKVVENTVDVSKTGEYIVTYSVMDSKGATVVKTIKVTVKDKVIVEPTDPSKPSEPKNPDSDGGKGAVTIPNTGGTNTTYIVFGAILIIVVGTVFFVYKKKDKKSGDNNK